MKPFVIMFCCIGMGEGEGGVRMLGRARDATLLAGELPQEPQGCVLECRIADADAVMDKGVRLDLVVWRRTS